MSRFTDLYKQLNKEQKEAVKSIDGPIMIIAGPGTGKTFTLTMRIANILKKTDTSPESILALTYTESGVRAMRKSLVNIIGSAAYYININTFHSFCSNILREYEELFAITEDTLALSEIERIQIFKEIIDSSGLDKLRHPNVPYLYLHDLIVVIQNLKREGVSIGEYENLIDDEENKINNTHVEINKRTNRPYTKYTKEKEDFLKRKELLIVYKKYQEKLKEMRRYDFEDMINFVINELKRNENLKLSLQEKYLYILVDEYQDTNSAQNEIIRLLTDHWEKEYPNIFVVGDDEQSIFRFQGASIENVLYFQKLFKKAKVITLVSNYRSSQYILDASRSLIKINKLRLENVNKNLISIKDIKNIPIKISEFKSADIENQFIVDKIKELIRNKVDPDKIAVLVRDNQDADDLKENLLSENIKVEISSGKNILEEGDINRLLLLLKIIRDIKIKPSNDIDLFTLLNYEFLDFKTLDILKLSRYASSQNMNLLDVILEKDIFNEVDLEEPEKFIKFIENLSQWQYMSKNTTFIKFFGKVLKESKFLNWILKDKNDITRLNNINTLFNEIKKLNYSDHNLNLESFLDNIEIMKENNVKIEQITLKDDSDAVKLLTAHKSKGLEFDYVFIAKCFDKKWGNRRIIEKIKLPSSIIKNTQIDQKEKNEDDRRLFYVAMTRARKELFITFSEKYSQAFYTRLTEPSIFLSEIDKKFLKNINQVEFEKSYINKQETQLELPNSEDYSFKIEDFLKSTLGNFKLNVTALNTYIECQYKFKINNLLKTPRVKTVPLAFGTAVHKALENFTRKYKKDHKIPNVNYLLKEYETALERELLTEADYIQTSKRGKKMLTEYYNRNYKLFVEPLYAEYSFGFKKVYLGDIPLSGKIDKMEWVNKDRKEVKVVDYKTGGPKSRNEILGKTKNSDLKLARQINFYKLLSNLDRNFNYNVVLGEFDFLESKSGKYPKKETFEYKVEEIEDLKNTIRDTMKKIRNLEFERTKDYKVCEKCDYRNHCWPDGVPKE
jgi:DNA helicase-2/ATP-dependent DNA helicase PcrA